MNHALEVKPVENSTRFAIGIIDLATREMVKSSVTATLNGSPVTEAMVAADVRRLNDTSGLDGMTLQKLKKGTRSLAFRLLYLQ